MKVIVFGATGMVGQGVLRECLAASDVEQVVTVGRTPTGQQHPKLRELVHAEMWDYANVEEELAGFDACFFCIGVTSSGMAEKQYTHMTYDLTLAAATMLARRNPQMVFVYVSGAGADSSETSRTMWERVRGRTENALLKLPFRGVYIFRPGMIQPMFGVKSKTSSYRWFYTLTKPLLPLLRAMLPDQILSTPQMGQAMLNAVRHGAPKRVLEAADINALSKPA
ncbi:NAD(P)H-binding protein [Massilia sp. R2A-15]|uniref:NAD(P)H-binding protein n=1 Tax=Massilia sp. R2A-15 TaxID=3064278 RepID=UPI0027372FA9|nr:NAD(P)H-binding protein [Massilia sp. R2A-15]WLI88247.1 NAD(P)H-binding protein [Massilia sp. R2A-15]